jgi:DNA-binding CsgD family transcriptional regulator
MDLDGLTERERQVLQAILDGAVSGKAVAEQLGISPRTVEAHMSQLRAKPHVSSTTELLVKALKERETSPALAGPPAR